MTAEEARQLIDEGLIKVAQVLAVGTGESQLHAAAEHVAHALGASSATVLAAVSDTESVYIVADSDEAETGRVRLPLAQYPHIRRAFETGEATTSAGGSSAPSSSASSSETSVVFPMAVGRQSIGALLVRFANLPPEGLPAESLRIGRLAAAILGTVLRGAKALDPIRERTRKVTLSDATQTQSPTQSQDEPQLRAIERYRAFIDSASDGILVLDAGGRVLYLNRAAQEVTGYARDGLVGRPLAQIVPAAYREMLTAAIGHSTRAEPIDNFDLELITTSGDSITVSVASIGILSEQAAAIFAFRDVTIARQLERELRRTTEFLERILNSAVDGIIAADLRGNILLFNQGAERICGYRAVDVIGNMSVKNLYSAGVAQDVMRLIRSAEHGGGGRLEPVRRDLVTATGELVPVSISAALVFDDLGREIATVGIFSDLRDRLRMEERLATAQEKLAISEKQTVAIELAGAAAHELNQPLTSVMGYAQMLIRKLGPQDPHLRIVETVLHEAERMAGIVRQLGSLTRYETKSYVGGAQIIDLNRSAQATDPEPGPPPAAPAAKGKLPGRPRSR
jgi:PAS domain S-box-containing protein